MELKEHIDRFKENESKVDTFVNGDENTDVVPSGGGSPYPTQAKAVAKLINSGGIIGAADLTALQAITPTYDNQLGLDESNGNLYHWDANAWVATGLNYISDITNYVDANGLFEPIVVASGDTTIVDDYRTKGWYIFNNAALASAAGLPNPAAGFLFVMSNAFENMVHQKWIPFNSNIEFTRTSNVSAVFPSFQKIITQSDLDARLTVELMNYVKILDIAQYTDKPYEIITVSKNLYDSSKKRQDIIVGNNGALQSSAGWTCSDFIPVTAGEYYTISFSTKRQNLAFYDAIGTVGKAAISFNTSASKPLTVQAPIGANFLVVNIDSNTITATNVQVEQGQAATPYEPYGKTYEIDASYITSSKSMLQVDGDTAKVTGFIENEPVEVQMLLTKDNTHSQSTVFNFIGDYFNNVLQRNLGDDVAPMRMDGTTIGANHGYRKTNVPLTSHGKTILDIGSVWTNGTKEFVIVDIIDANTFSVTSRTDNTDATVAEYTHVSGANNTASFSPSSVVAGLQWYPVIRDRVLTCFVDDNQIDLSKVSSYAYEKTVAFLESYSIMKKSDIVEWLIVNKGINHLNYAAVPCYTVSFGYTFDQECGCTIYFGGVGRKTVALVDQMITQSIQLSSGNGTVFNYIPKAIEFATGGFTYNFQNMEAIASKNPSNAIYLTAARQESGVNPIDRIIMLNDQVGYATGYLPVLDASPDVRVTNASNKYLEIRNGTLKIYPRLIDSSAITSINEGDAFAAIAYRKYFKRSADRTANYVVRSKMGDYLFLDWHSAKTDEIKLPFDLVGRNFNVVEKSSNVELLSKFASNSLLVKIDNSKTYGYLVLKFDK